MSETLKRTDFELRVGEDFVIGTGDGAITLKLLETRPLGATVRAGGAFALYFTGPLERQLPQATYTFSNEALGTLDIFIVPIARTHDGIRYEAIFT